MKPIITALVAAGVLAGVAAPVSAQPETYVKGHEIKHKYQKKKQLRYRHRRVQYWADKQPYGTSTWWQQMDRENRGGRR
jgi:hypothetical protein